MDASKPDYPTLESLPTQRGARTMAYDASADRAYVVTAEFGPRPAATHRLATYGARSWLGVALPTPPPPRRADTGGREQRLRAHQADGEPVAEQTGACDAVWIRYPAQGSA